MTITVKQIIILKVEDGQENTIEKPIRVDYFEDDLTAFFQELKTEAAKQIFSEFEKKVKTGVSVRTKKRRYQFQDFDIEYRRRTIRMPDGTERKPLDELLGFGKYQRQSSKAMQQVGAIAADLSYRKTAEIISYMNNRGTSTSTIGRQVWRIGKWLEEDQMRFEAAVRDLGNFEFLAQGTIYPDVIESKGIGVIYWILLISVVMLGIGQLIMSLNTWAQKRKAEA